MAYFSSSPPPSTSHHESWHSSNVFGGGEALLPSSSSITSKPPPPPSITSGALFGGLHPRRTTSNDSDNSDGARSVKSAKHNNGQLSPSFDQTFQSSMNISMGDIHPDELHSNEAQQHSPHHLHPQHRHHHQQALAAASSPCGMDISPLPAHPAYVHLVAHHQSPSHHNVLSPSFASNHQRTSTSCSNSSTSSSQSNKQQPQSFQKSFDQSFFSKLANHGSSNSTTSLSAPTSAASRNRTKSADVPLSVKDGNVSSSSVFTLEKVPQGMMKKPHGLLRTCSARPSLLSTSSSTSTSSSSSSSAHSTTSLPTLNNLRDPENPFQVTGTGTAPLARPSAFLERAQSDNVLSFGGATFPKSSNGGSRLVAGTRESSSSVTRPSLLSFGSGSTSQGRKISGSARVRSALPKEWKLGTGEFKPPMLHHAHSAPLVKPADWVDLENKSNSETHVPTRRMLASEVQGSKLANEVHSNLSSPSGMDIDTSSPHPSQRGSGLEGIATGSPGLGELFNADVGPDCSVSSLSSSSSSPPPDAPAQITNRKRGIQDADSSFNSQLSSSPVPSAVSGTILPSSSANSSAIAALGKGHPSHPPRLLHRATSALSLGAASRRRGSGNFQSNSTGAASSSSFLATLAAAAAGGDDDEVDGFNSNNITGSSGSQQRHTLTLSGSTLLQRENSGSSRHRKMSRGADGKPHLLKTGRRSYSMCDSEFYASPPLEGHDGPAQIDYFGGTAPVQQAQQQLLQKPQRPHQLQYQHVSASHVPTTTAHDEEVEEILSEDVLSPPRKALAPLNSYQPSPEASFTCGFGHKEAQGKILPCFPVKEDGLMRITADTLNDLLGGVYDDHIDQYVIIDCRFEYEYQGGHVEGAINLGTEKSVEKFLLEAGEGTNHLYEQEHELPLPSKSGEPDQAGNPKKTILVFHCEFSAKRAPTLAKYLRSRDRALNHAAYPSVHFPELYILQGGYAECWKKYPDRCEPRGYTPMDDPRHLAARANDLGEMRRKRMGVRAKSYTFGEGMFAASKQQQQQQIPPKHLSSINFKPASSSGLASSSFTAASLSAAAAAGNAGSSSGNTSKARSSFNSNLFNVVNSSKLCIHEEEHDEDHPASSTDLDNEDGDHSFSNTRHGKTASSGSGSGLMEGAMMMSNDNSSPCGPMMGAGNSIALGGMSLGDSPCQASKPSKLARPGMMPLQPSSTARGLFKPRGMQRASTTIGNNFLSRD